MITRKEKQMTENPANNTGISSNKHCQTDRKEQEIADNQKISLRMERIKHKIMVLSGKGGVGKSTVAVNLAVSLAEAGHQVGLLDIDIHGPSVPQMLNLTDKHLMTTNEAIIPISFTPNLKVMSMGLLMEGKDEAVIWRGPLKMKMIKQFLMDVDWGELDYMIVDSPPGTGDEPMSIAQLLPGADGAVIVTTPQEISITDVRRCVNFCRKLSLKVLGVVENMSGFVCPTCGERIDLFHTGGGSRMAEDMNVPFLGSIPIDKLMVDACDEGKPFMRNYADSEAGKVFNEIVVQLTKNKSDYQSKVVKGDNHEMRIALPVTKSKLCAHFGHCESFALIDVDEEDKTIKHSTIIPSPGHQPGFLPQWLHEHGVNMIITGGMGAKAIELLNSLDIKVVLGAPEDTPEHLVQSYLDGSLIITENVCDHGERSCDHSEHKCSH